MPKPISKSPNKTMQPSKALEKVRMSPPPVKPYAYDIKPYTPQKGVVPAGRDAPTMAMDYAAYSFNDVIAGGFPGFQYLAQLATRAEYRAFASTLSTELTREWIKFTSKQDDDIATAEKIKQIEAALIEHNVRSVFQKAAEHDTYFGRGQIFINLRGADTSKPLILDPRTVKPKSFDGISAVEAVWTTPSAYNANDPTKPDFYKPVGWFMLGKEVHATRLMTIITRELPDILKPAFNFAGISLSQLAEPYVDNWLRTRQSVSDLINNFSITALATAMDQVLSGDDNGDGLIKRAELFTAMRSNKGLMILDKEREELVQVNTPLSGLHELQAQSQEQMCAVSRTPAVILTGISPSGLNASSDGEIRVFYDWIAAQQNAYWREPLLTVIKVIQLSLFGEIDPNIDFEFVPLYQMTPEEEAAIRKSDADAGAAYINAGVIDAQEERERLARDPSSGYQGLDTNKVIEPPTPPGFEDGDPTQDPTVEKPNPFDKPAQDAEFKEGDHPRADNGQFGSGGGGTASKKSFKSGGKDDRGYERAPGLDKSERETEQQFYDAIHEHGDKLIGAYHAVNGNVIDPDLVKGLNPKFADNPDLARAVHEPSSHLAKQIYSQALDRKAAAGDTSPTLFSAGGGGSGKSATKPVAENALGADPDGLFYDSTLSNFSSATKRIDEALAKTKGDVGIAYTNTPVSDALKFNAKRSRTVSIDTLLHAHVGASETIRKLAEHYSDNPRVTIAVVNNGIGQTPSLGRVADVPKYESFNVREQLVRQAKDMLNNGTIDQNKYNLLIK